jgi:hypothetical protein
MNYYYPKNLTKAGLLAELETNGITFKNEEGEVIEPSAYATAQYSEPFIFAVYLDEVDGHFCANVASELPLNFANAERPNNPVNEIKI